MSQISFDSRETGAEGAGHERRLNLALAASKLHVWTFDFKLRRISIAQALCAALKLDPQRCARLGWWRRRIHAGERLRVESAFRDCIQNGKDLDIEFRVFLADGRLGWLALRAAVITDDGRGPHLYGVCADISEQRATEQELRDSQQQLQTIRDTVPVGIARCSSERRYLFVNRAYARDVLGRPAEAATGQAIAGLIGAAAALTLEPYVARVLSGERVDVSTAIEFDKVGPRMIDLSLIPEIDSLGAVCGWTEIVDDVSERVRAQAESERLHAAERAARERAEAAASARDQFLAIVSHELRSPLNGIQNWNNVLQGSMPADSPTVVWRALSGIKAGVDQQVRLIEDLLDATRIMSGRLSLVRHAVDMQSLVEAVIVAVSAAAETRKIQLLPDLQLLGEQVHGDADRLRQIVLNLLSNALKFSQAGARVQISLRRIGSMIRLQVIDEGKGISADFLPHLFDWFGSAETSNQRGQGGLGLGLALVRHLCEMHGGHVHASSPGLGLGATFEVWLPAIAPQLQALEASSQGADQQAAALPSLQGLRLIVIDDQQDALEALRTLLCSMHAQVLSFSSGSSFIDWLRRQQPGSACADAVLCDIAMPGQDGYATLRQIRDHEDRLGIEARQRLRVIALTAFAEHEARVQVLQAGFALHLPKPLLAENLAAAILKLTAA